MLQLPADVLTLICEELGNRQDFGTLFNCALTSKSLVFPALGWLYKIHNNSPVTTKDDEAPVTVQRESTVKWSLLWNSIIRSSLGSTAYPYCLYIRVLDLRNLTNLLEDSMFWDVGENTFFTPEMAQILEYQESPVKKKIKTRSGVQKMVIRRPDIPPLLNIVGESITNFVFDSATRNGYTAALEDITGNISNDALLLWTRKLPKLKSMTLWNGSALGENVAESLSENCYDFDDLTFWDCDNLNDIDHRLASFFSGLRGNTLRSFEALRARAVGPETLLSLNHHYKSLTSLTLDGLKSDAIKSLSLLQGCDNLESLTVNDDDGLINLETTENDIFLEAIEWLGRCTKLRKLKFTSLISSPSILTQVCLKNEVRLRSLVVHNYVLAGNQDFHKAMSYQTSLEDLDLSANPEETFRDDIDTLVDSICCLTKLKSLRLAPQTADYFETTSISKIASHLPNLEALAFSGFDIGDGIWTPMARLCYLQKLEVFGLSNFTESGVLWYIAHLQDGNRGLSLGILAQNPMNELNAAKQLNIQQALTNKVDGKLNYELYRDPESDSEEFSD